MRPVARGAVALLVFGLAAACDDGGPRPSVSIAPETVELRVGERDTLVASVRGVEPGRVRVTWRSLDAGVVSVSVISNLQAEIEGRAPGAAEVAATLETPDAPPASDRASVTVVP